MSKLKNSLIGYPPIKSVNKFLNLELILKCIKKKSMSYTQIAEKTGIAEGTVRHYLRILHQNGEIYIEKYERSAGLPTAFYMTGQKMDALRPERRPITYYYQFKRKPLTNQKRNRNNSVEAVFTPKRDIAASWF